MERIVVPLDGSHEAEAVLPPLRALLDGRAAEIILVRAVKPIAPVHTYPGYAPYVDGDVWAQLEADARAYLRKTARELFDDGLSPEVVVTVGQPATSILETALRHDATLIAMATHQRRGLRRLFTGSVREQVVRRSPVPVLAVHRAVAEFGPILVPIRDESSLAIIPAVARLAAMSGSEVVLLHVVRDEFPLAALQRAQDEMADSGIASRRHFRQGDAAEEILTAVHELDASVVAMATSGRRRWFGVAAKVMRRSPVSTLVISGAKVAARPRRAPTRVG